MHTLHTYAQCGSYVTNILPLPLHTYVMGVICNQHVTLPHPSSLCRVVPAVDMNVRKCMHTLCESTASHVGVTWQLNQHRAHTFIGTP
jgi:hypothetical protein